MRTFRTTLAVLALAALGVAAPASAMAAPSSPIEKTPLQLSWNWGK
ncbi:hypothetical protein [Phycicoccus flavus]|uniref:Uncharacterized protein n=1 Tax=Phycicoccus flavus TaxID=2502783 RepID=A0A8T6R0A8_9MICO|nr:hypothetical protein [Phycicoccus flavus]NHA66880.1 hypothetical protein [Phycicoccus flavus]